MPATTYRRSRWCKKKPPGGGSQFTWTVAKSVTPARHFNETILLAIIHDAVAALDDGARHTADTVARRVVRPAGIAVVLASPGTAKVIRPYGVPGETGRIDVDRVRGIARPDIDPCRRVSLAALDVDAASWTGSVAFAISSSLRLDAGLDRSMRSGATAGRHRDQCAPKVG